MTTAHTMAPRYLASVGDVEATLRIIEVKQGHPAAGLPSPLARVGIALPKHPLEDTPYEYQVGLSSETMNPHFVEWRERCPDLQPADGKVSGVVVFDGDKVVGHYTATMIHNRPAWHVGVHVDYRGKGIATLAMLQWFKAAPFAALVERPISDYGARAALSAHKHYVTWAAEQGAPVPDAVMDSVGAFEVVGVGV